MKMKFFNRLMLALYALVWLLVLAGAALAQFAPDVLQSVVYPMNRLMNVYPFVPYVLLGVMALWSLGIFLLAFKREKRRDKGNVALQNTENGAVNVTVGALETLVREAIGQNDEVLELKSHVVNHEDSITVEVRMALSSTAHIPNVTVLMQRNIKRFIEEFSGIAVREVVITVTEVRTPEPASKKRALKNARQEEPLLAPAVPQQTERAPEAPAIEAAAVQEAPCAPQPVAEIEPEAEPVTEASSQETSSDEAAEEPLITFADEAQPDEPAPVPTYDAPSDDSPEEGDVRAEDEESARE